MNGLNKLFRREVPSQSTPERPATGRRNRSFLLIPLILVNIVAVWGQGGWAYDNLTSGGPYGIAVAALFAGAVESIGIYLAWEAHEALMADQASGMLRTGSYGIGTLAGTLNYLHFSSAHTPQAFATGVAFGCLSAISPWLWGIWSRARNRNRLAELGMVDRRGVKLSTARKLWHPIKSIRVMSHAAWVGETNPERAVELWENRNSATLERPEPQRNTARLAANVPAAPENQASPSLDELLEVLTDAPAAQSAQDAPVQPSENETTIQLPQIAPVQSLNSKSAKKEKIEQLLASNPDMSNGEIAKLAGSTDRWVRIVRNAS
jgi:hypothetical protein